MSDSETAPQPGFPNAPNGDVHISLGGAHKYTLHSSILRNSSPFFEAQLVDSPVKEGTKRDGVRVVRWRFELRDVPEDDGEDCGRLVSIDLDAKGMIKPTSNNKSSVHRPISTAAHPTNPIFSYYNRVLGSMHSFPFNLLFADLATLLREILGLITVADSLGCADLVAGPCSLALQQQGQVLYRAIATNPAAWVDLAVRVKSQIVFKEAIIHLVGQWNGIAPITKYNPAYLPKDVLALVEQKYAELDERKRAIEHRIVKYYPSPLTRDPKSAKSEEYNRQSYSNDVFGWIALNLFRHWFGAALASDKGRHAEDGGAWLYRTLREGGTRDQAYLGSQETNGFHNRVPMSVKGKAVFEKWLESIKRDVGGFVAPLLVSHTELDARDARDARDAEIGVPYLTCTAIESHDLPWVVAAEEKSRKRRREIDDEGREGGNESRSGERYNGIEDDEYESDDFGGSFSGPASPVIDS